MVHNIAIDGPAGAGKSTVAQKSSKRTFFCIRGYRSNVSRYGTLSSQKGSKPRETGEIGEACQNAEISIEYQNGEQIVLLDGENVNAHLRTGRSECNGVCKFCSAACEREAS